MLTIQLHNSPHVAVFDEEDYPIVSQFTWYYHPEGYAITRRSVDGKRVTVWMHRLILNAKPGQKIDHKDGHRLNNCRSNLRFASDANNMQNRRKQQKPATSKYKGVFWTRNRWLVIIQDNYKRIRVGAFKNEDDAARAYNAKALELFGEFAQLNDVASVEGIEPPTRDLGDRCSIH